MNNTMKYLVLLVVGAVLGGIGQYWLAKSDSGADAAAAVERKPLYWVAPMDANYRRDGPGKSPMGMDLVPYYAEAAGDSGPGTVRIAPEVENNLGVRTAAVSKGRLPTVIRTVGNVAYDEDHMQHIHSRVEGWVEKLHVKAEGDPVKGGAPLYDLYSPQLVNAQEELLLALGRNNERLVRAARARLSALQFSGANIDRLQRSRKVEQNVTVFAPQSGVIVNLMVREGFFVKPDLTMMSVAQLDPIWVVGEVFERQAGLVKVGDPVEMQLDYLPSRRWQGQIDYIYPSLNPQTRTAQLRMRFENSDSALKPNMYAQLEIQTQARPTALLVPREALIRLVGQTRVVLALGEGRFKSIAVEVGQIGEQHAEVLSDLQEGDEIVVSAQFLLDSESSKSSDFQRMGDSMATPMPTRVWANARIDALMRDQQQMALIHEPIPEWKWPAMTMDFGLDPNLDSEDYKAGDAVSVQIEKSDDGDYRIIAIKAAPESSQGSEQNSEQDEMDHSQMDHGEMDHSKRDRGTPDQQQHQP